MSARLYSSHEALPGAGKPLLLFPDLMIRAFHLTIPDDSVWS
jgi:hypothetical protein